MKTNKSIFAILFVWSAVLLSSCSAQNLNISVENNSTDYKAPQVFYWVNNDTGAEIKNIEWSINGVYFYTADLPVDGDHLDLFDFAKKDGTRYDYYAVKPIELKAKCSKGRYSVKFDDIPFDFGAVILSADDYKSDAAVYSWTSDYEIKTNNADGAGVTAAVVLGYKLDDKATSTEIIARDVELCDYLRRFFMRKTSAELSPTNEDKLQVEIKNGINDFILSSSKIRAVKFQSLDIQ